MRVGRPRSQTAPSLGARASRPLVTAWNTHPQQGFLPQLPDAPESTLTDRYQTTVPETVRQALKLGKRDKIHYTIRPNGEVVISRAELTEHADPILGQFLSLLAGDIANHPERLQTVDTDLVHRLQALVRTAEVDLDAPLSADDE